MLLSRQSLGAAVFASRDETRVQLTRVQLTHVRIDPDGTVWATDRHAAVRVARAPEITSDAEFPLVAGVPEEAKSPSVAVYVPRDAALDVAKRVPKRRSMPVLENALLRVTDQAIYLAVTDLERPQVVALPRLAVEYPPVEQVYEDAAKSEIGKVPFALDARYLRRVADFRKTFASAATSPVKITGRGPADPVSFEWSDGEGHEVHAVVMPIRL